MRSWIFLFIVLLKLGALAQTKFDYLSCQKVLTEKLAAIQLKIWNGVMEGKLTPYSSDSLTRVLSIDEINDKCKGMDTGDYQEHIFRCEMNSYHKNDGQVERIYEIPIAENGWDSWGTNESDTTTEIDSGWYEYYSSEDRYVDSVVRTRKDQESARVDLLYNLPYMCEARVDFVASRDILGISFGFDRSVDMNSWSTEFKCTNIGLMTEIALESGFVLGNQSLFHIRLDQLEYVLTKEEITFLQALSIQSKNIGDYLPDDIILQEHFGLQEINERQNWIRFDNAKRSAFIGQRKLALLSKYNSDVFFETVNYLLEEGNPLDYKNYLFKDSLLRKSWKGLLGELYSDGAFELVKAWRGITYPIYSTDVSRLKVVRIAQNDYRILLANEVHRVNSFPKKEFDIWIKTYLSYSSIKHLLQPHDRIILEALLEEIAN